MKQSLNKLHFFFFSLQIRYVLKALNHDNILYQKFCLALDSASLYLSMNHLYKNLKMLEKTPSFFLS